MDNKTNYNSILQKDFDVIISVRLTPNAKKNEFVEICDEFVKIKVNALPVDNKANKELIAFLSGSFDISKSRFLFCSGEKSKLKKILIKDTNIEEITKKILFMINLK